MADIVLDHLNSRDNAVEEDSDSPTGKGYTGLEALLQYVYDQTSLLLEYDETGAQKAKYDYGSDRLISLTRADEGRRFFSFDGLRTVTNLTSDTGSAVASYHLDAWGNFRFPSELLASKNRFAFTGYLPTDAAARTTRLRELEARSRQEHQTQIFIETPYRNAALLQALMEGLQPATWLSVSCGLTLPAGFTRTDRVQAWRQRPSALPGDAPAVFSLLAA